MTRLSRNEDIILRTILIYELLTLGCKLQVAMKVADSIIDQFNNTSYK